MKFPCFVLLWMVWMMGSMERGIWQSVKEESKVVQSEYFRQT